WAVDSGVGKVRVEEISTGKTLQVLEGCALNCAGYMPWSADSKRLATHDPGSVQIWDVQTGKRLHVLRTLPSCVAFCPDGKLLATGSSEIVILWDVASGEKVDTFRGHKGVVGGLFWSADGKTLTSS